VSEARIPAPELEALHPGLLAALVAHPGIGFILVRTTEGPVVLGARGVHHLADGRIDGDDPLAPFGERAPDHLRRLDTFRNVGDILVNSAFDEELGEVAAFEELVGSHGGLGGPQNQPFILHPASLPVDEPPLVGAPAVNRQLRAWARRLGIESVVPMPAPSLSEGRLRGLVLVATYIGVAGLLVALGGLAILLAVANGAVADMPPEAGRVPAVVAIVLTGVGLAMLLTSIGIWRRQRWAWMTALVLQGVAVLQLVLATASGGVSGIVSFGVVGAVFAVLVFYYLTRPHVAAAFGRHPGRARSRTPSVR
jgi:hypothetical protein